MKKDKNYFLIGEVAKNLGIHDQTIRMYERKHLIKPQRNEKNIRLFSNSDLIRIAAITKLTQEIGINLAGVKLVFSLARKMKMSDDELLDFIDDHTYEFLQ